MRSIELVLHALIILILERPIITPKPHYFSEHKLTFTFTMLSPVRLPVVCLSVTLVHTTQAVEIFGNISTAFGMLAIR